MMERKFAKFFHRLVQELIPDNGQRDQLFDSLRRYQSSQKLHQLLVDLRQLLDEPDKLELFEFIRPLILLRHQMEYSYLTPPAPGVRLRTVRLHRSPNQSLGFAVRGGYEFSVGVFVSKVESGSQADRQGLKVGDEIVRVNGFTIAEAIHDDVLNLIKSRDEIVLKVTHIGMLPVKEHASDTVTWQYVEDMDSKRALDEVLAEKQVNGGKGVELKIFIDCTGYDSIGCGILSGPHYYPGIFVEKVRPGSLAQEVGLEVGDQIVEVNDTSFSSIGHKEAVVVLKGSKQLNVIVRKHAGLPLFERRQATPSRGSSSVTAGTSPAPSNISLPTSQRSISTSRPPPDSSGLTEDQLIAEQLGRTSLLKQTATSSSQGSDSHPHPFPHRQTSIEGHMISTQAEVHSDSDSYHGSGGEGTAVPVEEPSSPASSPTPTPASLTPPSSPTPTPIPTPTITTTTTNLSHFSFIALPDTLDKPINSSSSSHEAASSEHPIHHHHRHHHHHTPSSSATSTDSLPTTTTPTPTPSLSLPDDLGDPVLAALRRPIYPPDAPEWVIPLSYACGFNAVLARSYEGQSSGAEPHLENAKSAHVQMVEGGRALEDQNASSAGTGALDRSKHAGNIGIENGEEKRGASSSSFNDQHSDSMAGTLISISGQTVHISPGLKRMAEVPKGQGLQDWESFKEKEAVPGDGAGEQSLRVNTAEEEIQPAGSSTQRDENANIVTKAGGQTPQSDTTSHAMPSTTATGGGEEEAETRSFSSERSNPPVFVPPPPPSSPPPPVAGSSSSFGGDPVPESLKVLPSLSRLSSASTQTLRAEEGDETDRPKDGFDAVMEFGSETSDEPSLCGEVEERLLGEVGEEAGEGNSHQGKDVDDHGDKPFTATHVIGIAGPSLTQVGAGFDDDIGTASGEEEEEEGGEEDVRGVGVWQKSAPKLSVASRWSSEMGDDGENGINLEVSAEVHEAGPEVVEVGEHDLDFPPPPASFFEDDDDTDTEPGGMAGTHTDTHTEVTATVTNTTPAVADPLLSAPTSYKTSIIQTTDSPPPSSPLPSVVLGGAAAVLAARREEEEKRSPRLLGPAEPLSSGGVGSEHCPHDRLAALFNPLELDGRELKAFSYPKTQPLGVALEGGMGTPLAGRIVVAAVFGSGAAIEQGLQTGDQLMMVNGHKLLDISVTEAEQILENEAKGSKEMIQLVYAQSNFLNDEECVTYF